MARLPVGWDPFPVPNFTCARLRSANCKEDRGNSQPTTEQSQRTQDRLDDDVLAHFNVLPFDTAASRDWVRLMRGQSNTLVLDGMIAAIAKRAPISRSYPETSPTFEQLGIPVLNPFEFGG